MSCCAVALDQRRFTWRHNEVLRILHFVFGRVVCSMTKKTMKKYPPPGTKVFVQQGQRSPKAESARDSPVLQTACDWVP
jgi:hypothetical protein